MEHNGHYPESFRDLLIQYSYAFLKAKVIVWLLDFSIDKKGKNLIANDFIEERLGIKRDDSGYFDITSIKDTMYPDEEGERTLGELIRLYHQCKNGEIHEFTLVVKHKNVKTNEVVYLRHFAKVESRFDDGSMNIFNGYCIDETPHYEMQKSLSRLEEQNQQLILANANAIRISKMMTWRIDFDYSPDGSRFYANDVMDEKLGLKRDEDGLFALADFAGSAYPDEEGQLGIAKIFEMFNECIENKRDAYTYVVKHIHQETGEVNYFEHNAEVESRREDGSIRVLNGYNNNVTEQIEAQKRNEYLVQHDLMTKLKNRNSFEEYIDAFRFQDSVQVIVIDIDGLKLINDSFGHLFGDRTIKELAGWLREEFGDDSEIFRIGGDEFAIISTEIDELVLQGRFARIEKEIRVFENPIIESFSISYGYDLLDQKDKGFMTSFVEAENAMYHKKLSNRVSRKSKSLDLIMETLHQKTEESKEHCKRVEKYSIELMKRVGYLRGKDFDEMGLLCKVHDIGKITVSEELLNKPGLLTSEERKKIQKHTDSGYKIVKNIIDSENIALGVLHHHERVDGNGYPFGLRGKRIPPFARIVCITDAYDAMTSKRIYSDAMSKQDAIEELEKCAGKQFDKQYVEEFVKLLKEGVI